MTFRQSPETIVQSILLPHQKDAFNYKEIKHGWSKIPNVLAIGHGDFKGESMAHT